MTNKTLVRIRVWAWIKIYMRTRNYYPIEYHSGGNEADYTLRLDHILDYV